MQLRNENQSTDAKRNEKLSDIAALTACMAPRGEYMKIQICNMYHLSIAALTACKLAWHGGGIQTNEHPAYPAVSRHRLIQNTQKQKYNHTNTNTKVQIHQHKYKQIQKYPACPAVSHPRL